MLDYITTVSTAATAIIAAFTYIMLKKQWAISQPTIKHRDSGDSKNKYRQLSMAIENPYDVKFKLEKLTIISPPNARVAKIISDTNNNPSPGDWKTELFIDYSTPSTGVFFTAPRGSEVIISVQCALKSDASVKSRYTITSKMHD